MPGRPVANSCPDWPLPGGLVWVPQCLANSGLLGRLAKRFCQDEQCAAAAAAGQETGRAGSITAAGPAGQQLPCRAEFVIAAGGSSGPKAPLRSSPCNQPSTRVSGKLSRCWQSSVQVLERARPPSRNQPLDTLPESRPSCSLQLGCAGRG